MFKVLVNRFCFKQVQQLALPTYFLLLEVPFAGFPFALSLFGISYGHLCPSVISWSLSRVAKKQHNKDAVNGWKGTFCPSFNSILSCKILFCYTPSQNPAGNSRGFKLKYPTWCPWWFLNLEKYNYPLVVFIYLVKQQYATEILICAMQLSALLRSLSCE